jgi:hypothetical protein
MTLSDLLDAAVTYALNPTGANLAELRSLIRRCETFLFDSTELTPSRQRDLVASCLQTTVEMLPEVFPEDWTVLRRLGLRLDPGLGPCLVDSFSVPIDAGPVSPAPGAASLVCTLLGEFKEGSTSPTNLLRRAALDFLLPKLDAGTISEEDMQTVIDHLQGKALTKCVVAASSAGAYLSFSFTSERATGPANLA